MKRTRAEYLKHYRYRTNKLLRLAETSDDHSTDEIESDINLSDHNTSDSDIDANISQASSDNVSTSDTVSTFDNLSASENVSTDVSTSTDYISSSDSTLYSESDNDSDQSIPEIGEDLAKWAVKNKLTRSALNEILQIFRQYGFRVPADARTLLRTPRIINVENKCGGQYTYLGLKSGILKILAQDTFFCENNDLLKLEFNIDGLPLFKSSIMEMWPVLCAFGSHAPFVVVLYCGKKKPSSVHDYLEEFLQELSLLQESGVTHAGKLFRVEVFAFICDAPARSFVKCIKSHTGYYACERCIMKGQHREFRIVYLGEQVHALRTDEGFFSRNYPDHQTGRSPLIEYQIPCVNHFALDYMHLVCLGVTKRILIFLKGGGRNRNPGALSSALINDISQKLVSFSGKIPTDFARQPRPIAEFEHWKATEYRQFLLYTGPIVLKDALPAEQYEHFLCLSVAVSIMLYDASEKRNAYLQYASELLEYFIKKSATVYGKKFPVYNVHGLLHLPQDVAFFDCSLNKVSSFKFENCLQSLKKKVRSSHNPIAQVCKRITEKESGTTKHSQTEKKYISTKEKDKCFLMDNQKYAFVEYITDERKFVCKILDQRFTECVFQSPCESKLLDIVYMTKVNFREKVVLKTLQRKDLKRKVVRLPFKNGWALFPMLHGVEGLEQ